MYFDFKAFIEKIARKPYKIAEARRYDIRDAMRNIHPEPKIIKRVSYNTKNDNFPKNYNIKSYIPSTTYRRLIDDFYKKDNSYKAA